jgi:hypothetical protein
MNTYNNRKRGALLIEVIVAFALFMLTAIGLAQFMAVKAKTGLTDTLTTHVDRQLHLIGGYLASDPREGVSALDFSEALKWSGVGTGDRKLSETTGYMASDAAEMLPIIMNANGDWLYPLPQDYPSVIGAAYTDDEWFDMKDSTTKRLLYWQAAGNDLTLTLGGPGNKQRTLSNGSIKTAKGLPYSVQAYQEVTYIGDKVCGGSRAANEVAGCPNSWNELRDQLELGATDFLSPSEIMVVFRVRGALNLGEGSDDLVASPSENNSQIVVENAYARVR